MKVLGGIAVLIISIAAITVYLHGSFTNASQSAAVAVTMPVLSVPGISSAQTSGYEVINGTAIMDTSAGTPAVPYISYQVQGIGTVTKQLIFADSRGCYPSAGDLPCAPTAAAYTYPVLTTGEHIHVEGNLYANRFLVDNISAL